jgi:POT family proton-dependent oligopeptide transporter
MTLVPLGVVTWVLVLLFKQTFKKYTVSNVILALSFVIIWIISIWKIQDQYSQESLEVPASWFATLNSLFIISLAPLFSKWWESKYNPSANAKYGIGLALLGIGMAVVAFGSRDIEPGVSTATVSMIWLILVYFFHTMGELCIAPVGLSYVSKLVPVRMLAFMFGVWNLAVAIGMKAAGKFGESIDRVAEEEGISYFFWLLAIISFGAALVSILFKPAIEKLMGGVR